MLPAFPVTTDVFRHRLFQRLILFVPRIGGDLGQSGLQFIQRLMNYSYDLGFIDKTLKTEQIVDTAYLEKASR